MSDTEILDFIKKSFELKNQGYYKPAIEMLYKALALDCDNLEILAQLSYLYKVLGNSSKAIYYAEKVLEIDNKHLDCLNLLEEIYLIAQDLPLAKNISDKIYNIQPNNQNLAKKINILNKLHDFDAIKELEASISEVNDEVYYELASTYYDNYDFSKAQELLEIGYEHNNKNEKMLLLLAKIYYKNKALEQAKKVFTELEKLKPTSEVLNYLGLFKLNEKNFTAAIDYFQKALKLDDKNHEYIYNLASAYFLNGWLDEALSSFNQALCLAPDNVDYRYSLAYLYYQKALYDKAASELSSIRKIEPNHGLSNTLNAMILAKKGDLLVAKSQLENIIKDNQTDDFAYSALGTIYKELSQPDLAIKSIKKAIELNDSSIYYLSDLIEIEFQQKNYDEAMELTKRLLELNENFLYGHIANAKISFELKNFEKVFEAAQNIIELEPNCPEGYYYNAISLFQQGDTDFAIISLKKAISLDLYNSLLYVKMSEFYQDLGDFKTAFEWAREACEIDERNYQDKWLCAKLAATLRKQDEAIKYYSQSYRLASHDKDLKEDYANYLKSIGKEKEAAKILKS